MPWRREWQPIPVFISSMLIQISNFSCDIRILFIPFNFFTIPLLSHIFIFMYLNSTRIDAFELWCWRRLLRVPWTRRSNQSNLKGISPEYSLEGLMFKLQSFGHLVWRNDSLEKTLMLGKIEGRRRRGWQRTRWLDHITDSVDMSLSKHQETVKESAAWCPAVRGVTESLTCLSNWTTTAKHGRGRNSCGV